MRKGFTLAEVLITLAVIGVVAALAIPSLLTNTSNAEYKAALKKAYATLTSATSMIAVNYDTAFLTVPSGHTQMRDTYIKYMPAVKTGQSGVLFPPFYPYYKNTSGGGWTTSDTVNDMAAITSDGCIWRFTNAGSNCTSNYGGTFTNACGYFEVDVNGTRGPNRFGFDLFAFVLLGNNGYLYVKPFGPDMGVSCTSGATNWAGSVSCTQNMLYDQTMP